jgi:hypothetical protein
MELKDWYKNFITYDEETTMFTVWDETQAYIVGCTHYHECAVAILEAYAELLEKESQYVNG